MPVRLLFRLPVVMLVALWWCWQQPQTGAALEAVAVAVTVAVAASPHQKKDVDVVEVAVVIAAVLAVDRGGGGCSEWEGG